MQTRNKANQSKHLIHPTGRLFRILILILFMSPLLPTSGAQAQMPTTVQAESSAAMTVDTITDEPTITVNTLDNELNTDGDCSLREAIAAVNANGPIDGCAADKFDKIDISVSGTISRSGGTLEIKRPLTILGPGARLLTLDSNGGRMFRVRAGIEFNLRDVTITNGGSGGATSAAFGGGAIWNDRGTVFVNNVAFLANCSCSASGGNGNGGAIANGGVLIVRNSTFRNNRSPRAGGAIFNFAGTDSAGIVYNGSVAVINSTFSGNATTQRRGGAIANANGILKVINSTIAGNHAVSTGGGIDSTVLGELTLRNTIVANNTAGSAGPNCRIAGTLHDEGGNLENRTSCGLTNPASKSNANANLGPLQNNGGPTDTMALLLLPQRSDGIDMGVRDCPDLDNVTLLAYDQRGAGFPRRLDGDENGIMICDSGAYEAGTTETPTDTPTATNTSTPTDTQTPTPTLTQTATDTPTSVSPCPSGKIVVANDEWIITDAGFLKAPDTSQYVRNVANWFMGGKPGKFLRYGRNHASASTKLAATMIAAGYSWTDDSSIPFTLPILLQYDGIFLEGIPVDNQVVIDYVNAGGNVYLAGGTAQSGGPAQEAAQWNTFLRTYGLQFEPVYNNIVGVVPINSIHPVFSGVNGLYQAGGNSIDKLSPSCPGTEVFTFGTGQGLYAVVSQASDTPTPTPTGTATPTLTATSTYTHTPTSTLTKTPSYTPTSTGTPTFTSTPTYTPTATQISCPSLSSLDEAVNADIQDGSIASGVGNSLLSKLNEAQKKSESGQTNAAVNVLQAFIHSVEAQRGKHISAAVADDLIAQAQAIISLNILEGSAATGEGDLFADTDGDGFTDSVTIVPNGIQVVHGCTGRTSFYAYSGVSFSLSTIKDTDGQPGAEIIVLWTGTPPAKGIDVIHDRTRLTKRYSYEGLQIELSSVTDTDGQAGDEIVVLWTGAYGDNGIKVIHDLTQVTNSYGYQGVQIELSSVTDTDGQAGAEIVVLWAGAYGDKGINVIHDRMKATKHYNFQGIQISINSVTDTDGEPGAEIIVLWAGTYGDNGIKVIHDRTEAINTYTLNTTIAIGGVRDYDGIAGAEICYSWFSGNTLYSLIVDRTRRIIATTGC